LAKIKLKILDEILSFNIVTFILVIIFFIQN